MQPVVIRLQLEKITLIIINMEQNPPHFQPGPGHLLRHFWQPSVRLSISWHSLSGPKRQSELPAGSRGHRLQLFSF